MTVVILYLPCMVVSLQIPVLFYEHSSRQGNTYHDHTSGQRGGQGHGLRKDIVVRQYGLHMSNTYLNLYCIRIQLQTEPM